MSFIRYIADEGHYKDVLSLVSKAKRTVWNESFILTQYIKQIRNNEKSIIRFGCTGSTGSVLKQASSRSRS